MNPIERRSLVAGKKKVLSCQNGLGDIRSDRVKRISVDDQMARVPASLISTIHELFAYRHADLLVRSLRCKSQT
jgi:hypothetical protein